MRTRRGGARALPRGRQRGLPHARSRCGARPMPEIERTALADGFNRLGASFGSSMLERAVIDARRPPGRPQPVSSWSAATPRHRARQPIRRSSPGSEIAAFLPDAAARAPARAAHRRASSIRSRAADVAAPVARRPARDARGVSRPRRHQLSQDQGRGRARRRPRAARGDRRRARPPRAARFASRSTATSSTGAPTTSSS